MKEKIRMGMIGGGKQAFIGAIHRMAANLDGLIELSCGAFSSNPETSKTSGEELFIPANRTYGSYKELFEKENQLPINERIHFVSIVTPVSYTHLDVYKRQEVGATQAYEYLAIPGRYDGCVDLKPGQKVWA